MQKPIFGTAVFAVVIAFSTSRCVAERPVKFTAELDCIQVPSNTELGKCSGVGVDAKGQVFVLHRGKHPILCFDKTGKFLHSFGDDYIAMGHGLKVDAKGNVWATCTEHHMVYKFSGDGKLLLTLGQLDRPGTGTDPPQFDQPTDVAVGPGGEIYVADGYGNSRMVKFSPQGKFLSEWGTAGDEPGQFHAPHQVDVDRQGRVIVADRDNNRLQVFDNQGKLQKVIPIATPFGIVIDSDGVLFVSSGDKIHQLDKSGAVLRSWGSEGSGPLQFKTAHQIAIDKDGHLFVAEVAGLRLQKLRRDR